VNIKNSRGRPTIFTSELGEEICLAIAISSKALRVLCEENSHWPNANTICEWRIKIKQFGEAYLRAKQQQIEILVDEIIEIADDTTRDNITNCAGQIAVDHEHINRSRLRIAARQWLASKLCPRLYGDRVQCDSTISITRHEDAIEALR
jgi:hypothetical protein